MLCGLVPLVMLPLSWWLTLRRVIDGGGAQLRRRLLAIAVFDTILAIALGIVLLTKGMPETQPTTDPPRIGIQVDAAFDGPGARVASVWQASPAERSGLRQGDVIKSIDGSRIDSWERLNAELRLRRSGDVRRLRVLRGAQELTIDVAPVSGLAADSLAADATARPLFDTEGGPACGRVWWRGLPNALWPAIVGCLVIGAIALWGGRRRRSYASGGEGQEAAQSPSTRWAWVLVPLTLAPIIGVAGAYGACTATGGWSVGAALIGLIAQGIAMLTIGWLVLRALRTELDARMGPQLSTARAARLAVLYIASAIARAGIALYALMTLFPALQQAQDPAVSALLSQTNNPWGRVLLITAAVLLAPLSEEVVFRGILLPGLAQHMRTQTALIVSAAIFGLFHVPSHGIGAVMPGVLGLVFGWARLRTGSLAAPIMLHMANNLLVTLLAWGL